jgi:hypothetical protein
LVVIVAILMVLWLNWFLTVPLPNAANVGGKVTRSIFLWRAFPEVVPGVKFHESYLGLALKELCHVEHLPQRLPIVSAGVLIAGAALALGHLVLRGLKLLAALGPFERIPLAYGLGTAGLGLLMLGLGRLGWLAAWPIRIGLIALVTLELGLRLRPGDLFSQGGQGFWSNFTRAYREHRLPLVAFAFLVGPFLLIMALGSMLPTIDFDSLEYHLQGPKEYFQAGRIAFLPHNVYTSMPFGVEMLHLLGMEVIGDWWKGALVGQFIVMLFAPAAAAILALVAARWVSARAAWYSAVVYLTTPWIVRLAIIPYVEGPICYFHAALLWAVGRACNSAADDPEPRTIRFWALAGLLAGGSMACKYTSLVTAVIPFGVIALLAAWKARSIPIVLAFGIGSALVIGPWLAKNVVDTGNPVYPLSYRVFGASEWSTARDSKWSAVHGPREITKKALRESLKEVAGQSDWQSPLYTALLPLALLRPGSRRVAGLLLAYVLHLFATWWLFTHRLDRFWLPLLPAAAVLAGMGADWTRMRVWPAVLAVVLTLSVLACLAYCTTALVGLNEWTHDLDKLRESVPEYLNQPLARLDAELPRDSKILLVGQASVFHLRHAIIYNTVFNEEIIEVLARGHSPEQVREALRRLGVTHIYVDWPEITRHRKPGGYGFTPFVTPEVFTRLVRAGVIKPIASPGPDRDLYQVVAGVQNLRR